jgi:hypothetical protein
MSDTPHNLSDLRVILLDTLKKTGIVGRELQVLTDGLLTQTVNITDLNQTIVPVPSVDLAATITLELRDINEDGTMSTPLVYEFTTVDGAPQPSSAIFQIKIHHLQQGC